MLAQLYLIRAYQEVLQLAG